MDFRTDHKSFPAAAASERTAETQRRGQPSALAGPAHSPCQDTPGPSRRRQTNPPYLMDPRVQYKPAPASVFLLLGYSNL